MIVFFFPGEISKLENHFRTKWLGGDLDNFPLLVRLSSSSHPDFDLQTLPIHTMEEIYAFMTNIIVSLLLRLMNGIHRVNLRYGSKFMN